MARGRAPGYDDQRELILARAAALFAARGYPATSMNQVAEACGCSKAGLYHYYKDKYALLVSITEEHVCKLRALTDAVQAAGLPPEQRLRTLIKRIVEEYAGAQHAHRVLTEDVRFLEADDRARVLGIERAVVAGFAQAVADLRPGLQPARLDKPLTMLLFGMINWMFTWMRPDGDLDYDTMAPIVADLFVGGIHAVALPAAASPQAQPAGRAGKAAAH
ncbi:MAG: TetR family transcriptional regulator [Burkholderiales bacterium PBB5]|nr:MAG: TetR family transcriptional regulator [Burkholderiales bacterium PBB5]